MSDNGIFTNVFTYLLFISTILIFFILIYFICLNRRGCCSHRRRSGYENFESESALSPIETRLAKSSFYVKSTPSQAAAVNTKYKPDHQDQEVSMPTPVDFPVFKMLHERFKLQVNQSTQKYYEMKESATKPLIEF